jgi:hypothetical protein
MGMKRTKATSSSRTSDAGAGESQTPKAKRPRREEESIFSKPTKSSKPSKSNKSSKSSKQEPPKPKPSKLSFDYRYIVAPMVGASELPFRLMCRKYGAQLCYTPMMMAKEFASSKRYREREFPTSALDRPLVCHFAANTPAEFAAAAKLAAPHCDAIDLNLGW